MERSEVHPRASEGTPLSRRSFSRKVNPRGEVRGQSEVRVIGCYRGRSIPGERSEPRSIPGQDQKWLDSRSRPEEGQCHGKGQMSTPGRIRVRVQTRWVRGQRDPSMMFPGIAVTLFFTGGTGSPILSLLFHYTPLHSILYGHNPNIKGQ